MFGIIVYHVVVCLDSSNYRGRNMMLGAIENRLESAPSFSLVAVVVLFLCQVITE